MLKTHTQLRSVQPKAKEKPSRVVKMEDWAAGLASPDLIEYLFWRRVDIAGPDACWNWHGSVNIQTGYGQLAVNKRLRYAHRLSFVIHHGKIDENRLVIHSCDNRRCVNPKHLSQGTHQDNRDDAKQKNRLASGERHGLSVLTEREVVAIRKLHSHGIQQRIIALAFGIAISTTSQIVHRIRWSHIQ